ncbi:MAG: response regulator [Bdellovibrionales bacterium]|jgi:DNA-binding response OmpR family regulator|nr:response regulator [Bdellovibrionales bacterium]
MIPKLLAVDDEILILELLEEILTEDQLFQVVKQPDAKAALELIKNEEFKLILLDFRMPSMNGDQFVKELREGDSINKNTPILFITANPEQASEVEGKFEKIFILIKPLDLTSLSTKVREAITSK